MTEDNRPRYRVLPGESVQRIHQASLEVLARVGVRVEDPALRSQLHDLGCLVEKDRLKLGEEIISKALKGLSRSVTLYAPDGGRVEIGSGPTKTHTTGGMPFILDHETGHRRYARTNDLVQANRLINQLDQIDLNCGLVFLEDCPPEINNLRQCEILLRWSRKPIYTLAGTPGETRYIVELFKAAAGSAQELSDNPPGALGISPESPLNFPKPITDSIKSAISAGVPTIMLPSPISGFTAPLTLAGGLVQQHASMLAFTTLAAYFNPAAPVVYGARLSFANMRSGNSIWGLPDVGRAGACAIQLADLCGLPSDVYGLSTNSCANDIQTGCEKAVNGLLPLLAGAGMISGAGGLASLTLASLEQLIIDNETIRSMRRLAEGFTVDEETLAVEAIAAAAGGKSYLLQEHTLRHLRTGEVFDPGLGFAGQWEDWEKNDRSGMAQKAGLRMAEILAAEPEEACQEGLKGRFESIIKEAEAELLPQGNWRKK